MVALAAAATVGWVHASVCVKSCLVPTTLFRSCFLTWWCQCRLPQLFPTTSHAIYIIMSTSYASITMTRSLQLADKMHLYWHVGTIIESKSSSHGIHLIDKEIIPLLFSYFML